MSLPEIKTIMSKLSTLHESLLELSKQKTDFLKDGDTNGIQKILLDEKKHIQAIGQLEEKRMKLTEQWFKEHAPEVTDFTITAMMDRAPDETDKKELNSYYERLIMAIAELKQQEQLNKELTEQSLQFNGLSLYLIAPTLKTLNYGNEGKDKGSPNRSIFDSKA